MTLTVVDQLSALRSYLFAEIDRWNGEHPHPLRSHHERGSITVAQVYEAATGAPTFTITIVCTLAGPGQLVFHGHDLATVAEHARLALEHRVAAELQRRDEKAHDDAFERRFGIAV